VVVPLIALAIDTLALDVPLTRSLRRLLPWLVLVIPCLLWTKAAQTTTDVPVAPLWARPLIALDSLAFYLYKLIWPVKLTVVYDRTPIQVLENGWCYYTWIAPVLVAVGLMLHRQRASKFLCAAAIFVAGVLPVLGFLPFQFQRHSGVADHYVYLSMLGVGLFGAAVLDRIPNRMMCAISAVVLVVLAALSFRQCRTWQNELRLWEQNLAVNPDSLTAHRKLAQIYASTGRQHEAIHHFQQVLRIGDQLPPARRSPLDTSHFLLGQIFMSRGDYAQAIEQFEAALKENPQLEAAREALVAANNQLRPAPTTR
jgi:tetratricopeptide (TPR) repeat protein